MLIKLFASKLTVPVFILILLLPFSPVLTYAQEVSEQELVDVYKKLGAHISSNRLKEAENLIFDLLGRHSYMKDPEIRRWLWQNLATIYNYTGRYDLSNTYMNMALETQLSMKEKDLSILEWIYLGMGNNYQQLNMYPQAKEYFEKNWQMVLLQDNPLPTSVAKSHFCLGLVNVYLKKENEAFYHLRKSLEICRKHNLNLIGLIYTYQARALDNQGKKKEAYKYFRIGIDSAIVAFGNKSPDLIPSYLWFGEFLVRSGNPEEARYYQKKTLDLCKWAYGNKHTLTSFAYKNMGDVHMAMQEYDSALYNYQKSLSAVAYDFNSMDYFSNPDPGKDSILFKNRLVEDLKSKAKAQEAVSLRQKSVEEKIKWMKAALGTIEASIRMIEIIRSNYLSEDNRVILAESQKEAYLVAVEIINELYSLTADYSLKREMYRYSGQAKSATLMHEITGNALVDSRMIPDSVRASRRKLLNEISDLHQKIEFESKRKNTDNIKVSALKDSLFKRSRYRERIDRLIAKSIPGYFDILRDAGSFSVTQVQKRSGPGQTIVDYLLESQISNGKRKLWTFVLTRDTLHVRMSELDSEFGKFAGIIMNTDDPGNKNSDYYTEYSEALHYMYSALIEPVERYFAGKELTIIPDEELEALPFEAFLRKAPDKSQTDFEGLDFLIRYYSISYNYSGSFVTDDDPLKKYQLKIVSFSPDYKGSADPDLKGTMDETLSILKWFKGKLYDNDSATREAFLRELINPSCLHLALHTMEDSLNSEYSYMLFSPGSSGNQLYNYEISQMKISSPMVVLSSCNSGTGTLHSGSGLKSIARSFFLAGARSVVKTSWEVNDESGSEIIKLFYHYLSKGMSKDKALRKAKLEFMKESSPAFSNPYYWAAYTILGDNSPVRKKKDWNYYAGGAALLTVVSLIVYFNRRRIFSARSV
ncbi:MAG TPA: CHAT domain-containing tetratricopeptide repeat protein [Bacteroidales bacterium]|nr:CHAT domain-containing tetratricopeptide repeat protein [Bacteroidales bacterium]